MRTLSEARVLALRVRAQGLAEPRPRDVAGAIGRVFAVQAQSTPAARLALRARSAGLTASDVDAAAGWPPVVVRTWAMRGTLHALPAAEVRWVVGLLGPGNIAAGRRRREQLGLDDATCARALAAIERALRGGTALTRAELMARLDVPIEGGQAPAHLLAYAANRGLVCRGPDGASGGPKGSGGPKEEPTYVLLSEWAPAGPGLEGDEALAELARRYLVGHAPATAEDFGAWSGLPAAQARRAFDLLGDETTEVRAGGPVARVPSDVDPDAGGGRVVRLLAPFDAYVLGYRDRPIRIVGGMVPPTVLVNGRIVGTWSRQRRGDRLVVTVDPPDAAPRSALRAEAEDIARFLGLRAAES